ncbi:hypothetical protein IAQ67_28550 (plasmid) [Paenibacillus peoriae]|uniref:Uncharacterized protein n=1 Tax=Paenibacillus peoriae TaxID=59893 RepID=A0A7H0YHE5_9BACL|nr:hypothetical protein [Paenibacillus peoriae]QNR70503.1 hypothetical protein IAQ67_28550 [Paenibacillus peoriae]
MIGVNNLNTVIDGNDLPILMNGKTYKGFYVSYSNYSKDVAVYGSDTTALVLGQMELFFVLNGDHRKQYKEFITQGFDKCLLYFKENMHDMNKYSDKL